MSKGKFMSLLLFLLMMAAAVLWQCNGIDWTDDLQYRRMPGMEYGSFWRTEGAFIETFEDVCNAIHYHIMTVNCRLPNLIQLSVNLIPTVIVDVLHGVVIALLMLVASVSVGGRRVLQSFGMFSVVALALWVMLPWDDNMLSSDFSFNYVWVSAASLCFVLIFYSDDSVPERYRFLQYVFALIVGTLHEGFSFPIILGSIMMLLIEKRDRRRRAILTLLVAIGAVSCLFTSGMMLRMQEQFGRQSSDGIRHVLVISILQLDSVYILMAVFTVMLWKRGLKAVYAFAGRNIMYIGIMVVAFAIAVASGQMGRAIWFVELVAVILTFRMLVDSFRWWRRANVVMGLAAGVALLVSMTSVAVWQEKYTLEIKEMCRQVEASGHPVAYIDLIDTGDAPWWTFGIPQSISSSFGNASYCLNFGFDVKQILILPEKYKDKPLAEWERLQGDAGAMGQFPYFFTTSPGDENLHVEMGEHKPAATPLDRLLSGMLTDDRQCIVVPTPYYWMLQLESGDSIYCYNINRLGHLMRYREILSVND